MYLVEVEILQRQLRVLQHVRHRVCRRHQQAIAVDVVDSCDLAVGHIRRYRQVLESRPFLGGEQHRSRAIGQRRAVACGHRAVFAPVEHRLQRGQLLYRRVAADIVVFFAILERHDQIFVETRVVGRRRLDVARERELVLMVARDVELFCRDLGALAHRQPGAGLRHAGELRLEMPRSQLEPGKDLPGQRPAAVGAQEDPAVIVGVYDRRVADRVRSARDAGLDLPERNLVADVDCGFDAGAAGALHVDAGRAQRQARTDDAFTCQVPVARVFDDGAERHVAQRLPAQVVLVDERLECGGHHVLVGTIGVNRMGATKRYADTADHRHPPCPSIVQHRRLP